MFALRMLDVSSSKSSLKTDAWAKMVEDLPVNVMVCDIKTFDMVYANTSTIETLRSIEHALPIKADDLVGSSIDVFHKNPDH